MVHLYSFMIGIVNIVKIIKIVIELMPNYDMSILTEGFVTVMKKFHSSRDNSCD